jgi:hypothetical protein
MQQLAEKEVQFKGAPYRLTLDPGCNVTNTPCFTHGMTISYRNFNTQSHRYVIDHCAYHDETTAYLRVLCFTSNRKTCGPQTEFPPLILAIPKELCNARTHPDIENTVMFKSPPPSFLYLEHNDFSPPTPSRFSFDQEEIAEEKPLGWKDWILQTICFK